MESGVLYIHNFDGEWFSENLYISDFDGEWCFENERWQVGVAVQFPNFLQLKIHIILRKTQLLTTTTDLILLFSRAGPCLLVGIWLPSFTYYSPQNSTFNNNNKIMDLVLQKSLTKSAGWNTLQEKTFFFSLVESYFQWVCLLKIWFTLTGGWLI